MATTLDRTADLSTDLVKIYRLMLLTRAFDERITLLSHQGRVAISASVRGHEAAQVASAVREALGYAEAPSPAGRGLG